MLLCQANQDLLLEVGDRLFKSSQDLDRVTYNSVIHWYGKDKAHKVALSAVKM